MSILSIRGLKKKFKAGNVESVLNGVNLSLKAGDVYCLLGANGAGKSTLLRAITGLDAPEEGKVLFWGKPLSDESVKRISFLEDKTPDFPTLQVRQYLELSMHFSEKPKDEKAAIIEETLKEVALWGDRDKQLGALSRGMRRRAGLAEVICHDPEILILDEPLEGLDIAGLIFYQNYLTKCREEKRTVLFTTHLISEVKNMVTRIGILHKGKILEKPVNDFEAVQWSLAQSILEGELASQGRSK